MISECNSVGNDPSFHAGCHQKHLLLICSLRLLPLIAHRHVVPRLLDIRAIRSPLHSLHGDAFHPLLYVSTSSPTSATPLEVFGPGPVSVRNTTTDRPHPPPTTDDKPGEPPINSAPPHPPGDPQTW